MAYASNSVLLTIAFIEGSAVLILLLIYLLLASTFSARYFRYWVVGWSIFFGLVSSRIVLLLQGSPRSTLIGYVWMLPMAAFLGAAAIECAGYGKMLKQYALWVAGAVAALGALEFAKLTSAVEWGGSLVESSLAIAGGWVLWRSRSNHRGLGWKLLAAGLLLAGLQGLDRPEWPIERIGLLRVSAEAFFILLAGIAMAVLVLEAGRARNDDLNEKLRRLSVISAQVTQSARLDAALGGILSHLVESVSASHGIVLLRDDRKDTLSLHLFASVGLSEAIRGRNVRIPLEEPWVRQVLEQSEPLSAGYVSENTGLQGCFGTEGVATGVLLRVPGKEGPLGILAIGCAERRKFEDDEKHYLLNVANLLGLTAQNIALVENAADSRRQWRDTFDSIDDLILVHSSEGEILRTNRAFADKVKVEPVAIVGKQVRDVLRRGASQWSRCPYCEGVAGKANAPDPSFGGFFLASTSVLHSSEGGRLGTIHVLKDFTSMRVAEYKFRNLFERAQEGVFVATPTGKMLDCNNALVRLYGCESKEELLRVYTPSRFYLDMADRLRLEEILEEYGEVTDFEFKFRRSDGEIRTAHLSAFVTRDEAGLTIAWQGFILDITDRRRAETEIRQRNEELLTLNTIGEVLRHARLEDGLSAALRKVMELVSLDVGAVYLFDESAKILRATVSAGFRSDAAQRSSSIDMPAELMQQLRQVRPTLLPGSAPALPQAMRTIQQQEKILTSQVIVLWSNERPMGMILVGCRELRGFSAAERNLLAAVGNQIATSIDKSLLLEQTREAYETLRHTQQQLLQSEKMAAVGQLISGVAHELNNPLTAILGYTQLLQSQEFPEDRRGDYIEKLYKQAQRTHHIVQSLLSFARQHRPERTAVQINKIVEDTLILREFDVNVANIMVHRDLASELPETSGDFHQLQQVFLNILNNAVDAVGEKTDGQGEIWIRTRRAGDRISIEFTNNGPPVENPHRIFDPFYTTKPVGKGTGLGLSICYGIAKEHGGEIQVRNSPRGVTFTVTLPLISGEPLPREGHRDEEHDEQHDEHREERSEERHEGQHENQQAPAAESAAGKSANKTPSGVKQ